MAYSEYWNPKNETLPREELQALQLLKLRRFCEWAYATTPFHQRKFDEAGFKPDYGPGRVDGIPDGKAPVR